jgi:type I restriction enzyme, S subunit
MELTKEKYKQTEVGLIPKDWMVLSIGDSLVFKNGLNKESEFFGYGTPIVNYMDVFNHCGISKKDIKGKVFLNSQELKNFSAKKGDVFFTRTSETQQEIGTSAVLMEDIDDCVFSGFILRGRPKNKNISSEYYQYCLTPNYVRSQIISTSSYTTRALTNGRFLSKVKIAIPPTLNEQKAIANALSDVDDLIANLDKLITKKKAIKQGAMQQLLTPPHKGGKRLAGFTGEWVEKKLGDFCKITTGKLDANAMVSDGDYRFYTCARKYYFIDKYAFDTEALLVSGNGANVGYVHYYNGKFNAYQRTYVLDEFSSNIHFMKCLLDKYLSLRIDSEKNDGNTPYIKMDTLTEMSLNLPSNNEEQLAIANILLDMDAEIEQLETKKAKYQDIKQGMMQELLTGKIRLV